jgi:DNA helicase-2/ATP-dependent DNA helicase PcrA
MEDELHKIPGPLLLLAGPGTGKTYRLAKRIKYLVEEEGIAPENITVITFTTSAARNMHERISDPSKEELFILYDKQPKMICTMHSLGFEILREKVFNPGLKENIRVVYSDRLRDILVGDAAQLAGFSRFDSKETAKCRQSGNCNASDEQKCKICEQYQNILRSCSAIDYDDMILFACKILKENPELLKKYRSYCKHLLVDEYQDINARQFELIYLLSNEQLEGLFVVGDDDQSIYSWRGGSPEFIRNFKKHFGNKAQIKPLQKSFRCHPHILEGAISVVTGHDEKRLSKGEFDYKIEKGEKIKVYNVPSDKKEAIIVRSIVERVLPSRSVLILLPYRAFSRSIIEELRKSRIQYSAPFIVPGEGLPLVSTLSQWLKDNSDSLSLRECFEAFINNPDSGIPSKRSKKREKLDQRENALKKISNIWRHVIERKTDSFWKSLELEKENDELYSKSFSAFSQLRLLNDSQVGTAKFMAEVVKTLVPWKKIPALLEEIDLWVETSEQVNDRTQRSGVQLMTLPGAKGLEADVVCVVGLEEETLPKSGSSPEFLAEQSRLMFVSMTRAIEELHLFYARKRSAATVYRQIYKKGEPPDIQPSRFLNSIPEEHKENKYIRA